MRIRRSTITIGLWCLQLCISLCLVSRIANCDDGLSAEESVGVDNSDESQEEIRQIDKVVGVTLAMRKGDSNLSGSSKCVRYGQQGQYAYRLYCDYCSIDHEKEDLPGPIKIVETSDCSALKPVCGRGNKKKKWYCGFCSLQKERAVFKLTCPLSSNKPSCEDETQGPDGTATQAPDNTPDITPDKSPDNTPDNTPDSTPDSTPDKGSKDKKYRYVKQYCVASEEDVTFNDCGQKAPSFGVKMPEFLEKYKTEL